MEFSKLHSPSLKELFVNSIEGKILMGELTVGTKLPTERELADMMGVSRAVVNSGISDMAKKGFLEVRPRVGAFVADYRRNGTMDILMSIANFNGGTLPEKDIKSLLEFRKIIDSFAVAEVIKNAADSELKVLESYIDSIKAAPTVNEVPRYALAFNRELSFLSDNLLTPLIYNSFTEIMMTLWERYVMLYGKETIYNYYLKLYGYILNRNIEDALNWVDAHCADTISGDHQIYMDK